MPNQQADRQQCLRRYRRDRGLVGQGNSLAAGILPGIVLGSLVEGHIVPEEDIVLAVGCNSPSWGLRSIRLGEAFAGWDTVADWGIAAGLRTLRQGCHTGMSSGRRMAQAGCCHRALLGLRKMVEEVVVGRHRREEVDRSSTF